MVDGQQQHVFLGAQPQQGRPQQRPAPQVERARGVLAHAPLRLRPALLRRPVQRLHRERHRGRREDALHRPALHVLEHGAQRLVPGDDGVQRAPQRDRVQRPAQPHGVRHVVDAGPRAKLVRQPEPLLRERQRRGVAAARARRDGRGGLHALAHPEPELQ
nr:hypothetical protein [uncultured bacterium]